SAASPAGTPTRTSGTTLSSSAPSPPARSRARRASHAAFPQKRPRVPASPGSGGGGTQPPQDGGGGTQPRTARGRQWPVEPVRQVRLTSGRARRFRTASLSNNCALVHRVLRCKVRRQSRDVELRK